MRRIMLTTSCSAHSSGRAWSVHSSCLPPTIRSMSGAKGCSTPSTAWRATHRDMRCSVSSLVRAGFSSNALTADNCRDHLARDSVKIRRFQIAVGVSFLRQRVDPLVVAGRPSPGDVIGAEFPKVFGIALRLILAVIVIVAEAADELFAILAGAAACPWPVQCSESILPLLLSSRDSILFVGAESFAAILSGICGGGLAGAHVQPMICQITRAHNTNHARFIVGCFQPWRASAAGISETRRP